VVLQVLGCIRRAVSGKKCVRRNFD
jgi:hypothetical protein